MNIPYALAYQRRVHEVEAIKWYGDDKSKMYIKGWLGHKFLDFDEHSQIHVMTNNGGRKVATIGDMIIKEADGAIDVKPASLFFDDYVLAERPHAS